MPRGRSKTKTQPAPPSPRAIRFLAPGLLVLFVALAVWAAKHDSVTVDEFAIVPSGYAKLLHPGELNWLNPVNPPLVQSLLAVPWALSQPKVDEAWWATPMAELRWIVGSKFMGLNLDRYDELFFQSRLMAIALGVLLIVSAWRWSHWLYGESGGLVTLALCALSPSLLAHGHLATVDVGATAFLIAASYCFHRILVEPRSWRDPYALGFAAAYGCAMAAKFTAMLCGPVFVTLAIVYAWRRRPAGEGKRLAAIGLLSAISTMGLLGVVFGFDGVGSPVRYHAVLSLLPDGLSSLIAAAPSPLPYWFLGGFDVEWRHVGERGLQFFFLGNVTVQSHPGYFVAALAMKEPVMHVAIALSGLALLALGQERRGSRAPWVAALLGLWFLGWFSLGIGSNLGVRYVLYSLVCIYVTAGACGSWVMTRSRLTWVLIAGLVVSAGSVVRLGPHFLSYFNEAVGGPEGGRRLLSDSNIDWGQDLKALRKWMDERGTEHVWLSVYGPVSPAVYGIKGSDLSTRPPGAKGLVAVSVHHLNGIDPFKPSALALAEPYRSMTPVGRAGYSILIFEDR